MVCSLILLTQMIIWLVNGMRIARFPKVFFNWVTTIKKELIELFAQNDENQFGVFMENSFGVYDPTNPIIKKYRNARIATPINASTASKPYHCT